MANTTKSIKQILESDELTAYEVYRLQHAATQLIDPDRAEQLRPQMIYNYTRNGLIVKGKKGSGKVIRYTVTEAAEWIKKWTLKNLGTEIDVRSNTTTEHHRDHAMMQSMARG
jgi:hypothetical protein